nr:replicative DNA helicase [Paracoccaceae bacterium]
MTEVRALRAAAQPGQPGEADPGALPHNIEAEQQLLGAILTNNELYDRVAQIVRGEHFFDPVHRRIWEVAEARIQKNALASPVTLKAFLEDDEGLKALGGPGYLARLAGAAIASFAARDYAQMLYDLAIRRELIALGRDISAQAASVEVANEPAEQIVEAEQRLYKLAEQGRSETGFQSFLKAVTDAVNVANAAYQRDGGLAGLSTGLADLDRKLGGLHKSDLLILAGRPSMG